MRDTIRVILTTKRKENTIAGNRQGGLKAAETNKARYGKDFFKLIGSKGGQATGPKGFALDNERAKEAGRKGGRASRRNGVANGQGKTKEYIWKGEPSDGLVFAEKQDS